MAYAAVASLLQTVDIILDHHHLSISPQFEHQIKSIHQHTCSLRSFIEGSSARVNNWEETIREVTNRAEDITELLLSDSLLGSSRSDELGKWKCEVYYSVDELEKVIEEMESVVSRVMGRRRVETDDGSDEELMEIVSLLREGSSSLESIAICGSSGMGKSTLAHKAYFHPLIVGCFHVRLWSTVTREGTLVRAIRMFLRQMKADSSRSNSEDELVDRLAQVLGGRKYLIWLDDVWSKGVMERLKMMLPIMEMEVESSSPHDRLSWLLSQPTMFMRCVCWMMKKAGIGFKILYLKVILVLFNWNPSERRLPDAAEGFNFPFLWFLEYWLPI